MEIWKDVIGYEGIYQVSNYSRVRNAKGRLMEPTDNGKGYLRFGLSKGHRIYSTKYLHRIVAEAFIPNLNGYLEINHKDENKKNNSIENLEWCTIKYNRDYGTRIKRYSEKNKTRIVGTNIKDGSVILLAGIVDSSAMGFNKSAVSNCLQGLSDSSGGYTWEYD